MSRVDHLVVIHSKWEAWSQKHQQRMTFLLQMNPSIPCRSCVQSLEESLQFPAEVQQHPGGRAAPWEVGGKQLEMLLSSWALNSIPGCWAQLHVYFKEIQPHGFCFLPGLTDEPFNSRRRDSSSGYPPGLFQQGSKAGRDVKVCKWNQPFLSAVSTLAISLFCSPAPREPLASRAGAGSTGNVVFGCAASPWAGIHLFSASIFRLLAPRQTPPLVFGERCLKCFPLTVLEQFL